MNARRVAIASLLALLGALTLPSRSLSAQQMTNEPEYPIGFGIAAGLNIPVGNIGDGASTGWNLQGFVDWTSRKGPFGVRGDISYGVMPGKNFATVDFNDLKLFSITGDGVWMIHPPEGSTSRTTPYLLAGVGLYHTSQSGDIAGQNVDNSSTNFGINFGGGVLYKLAGFSAFGEARFHNVFSGARSGSAKFFPLVVGLRFGGGR